MAMATVPRVSAHASRPVCCLATQARAQARCRQAARSLSSTPASAAELAPPAAGPPRSGRPLSEKEREFLSRAIRVNQAGELGANLIYEGQYAVFRKDPRLRPLIQHMWDQEKHHLATFDRLIAKHRIRPTAMRPLWNVGAYGMGLVTALLGEKAAMACTEAVEIEIGGHYNNQIRVLLDMLRDDPELLQSGELKELMDVIRQFRDDELEHLDTAVEHDAKGADGYEILHNGIRGLCKAAIYISERV